MKLEEALKLLQQIGEGFEVREALRMKMKEEVQGVGTLGKEGTQGLEELKQALLA